MPKLVVYTGKYPSVFALDHVLVRNQPTLLPDKVADRLLQMANFELYQKAAETEEGDTDTVIINTEPQEVPTEFEEDSDSDDWFFEPEHAEREQLTLEE